MAYCSFNKKLKLFEIEHYKDLHDYVLDETPSTFFYKNDDIKLIICIAINNWLNQLQIKYSAGINDVHIY